MESLLLGTRCCSKSTTARVGLPPVGQMFRARTTASKRSLRSRFKTQNVATEPLLSNKVRQGGPPPELWKAGSVDIAYDLDPTAGADPVESWSKTITDRPDGSQHVVARVFYPASTEGEAQSRQPYMPHFRYAHGISKFLMSRSRDKWWSGLVTSAVSLCIYLIGCEESYPAEPGRKLADDIDELPVVILSHGIGSNRYLYSTMCTFLATHGFVVVALEHTDGLASAAKPAGDRNWMYYSGWGDKDYLQSCSRHREQEVATCMRALSEISLSGAKTEHITASCVRGSDELDDILDGLKGRLDLQNIMLMGHSYGGATAAGVGSMDSVDDSLGKAACVVLYDPWYPAIPSESPARSKWLSGCPTLVLGSVAFNTETDKGIIYAEGEDVGLQNQVLRACASGPAGNSGDGLAGATLVVPNESQHTMVDDLGAVMLDRYAWFFRLMGRQRQSDQTTGKDMAARCYDATLAFLLQTVPLSPVVHSCASHHLSSRWEHLPAPDSLATSEGKEESTAAALKQFFEATRCNPSDEDLAGPGHGCLVCKDFEA